MKRRDCAVALLHFSWSLACAAGAPQPLQTRTCGNSRPAHVLPLAAGESFSLLGETADRWVVQTGSTGDHHARSVGPCGEDPQTMPDSGEITLGEGRVWIVQRETSRVGHWPVEGGAVTWIAEGEQPIGLVPGRGYIVLERAADTDPFGSAVLVGLDGTRQTLWADVAAEDSDEDMGADVLTARFYGFQVAGDVFGHLDGVGKLRVAHRDNPSSAHTVEGVASFALGPDGSWFVTREDDGVSPRVEQTSAGSFHVRGGVEAVALGRIQALPDIVHPSGWFELRTDDPPVSSVFVAATRTEVAMPAGFAGQLPTDAAGGLYTVFGGSVQRWDPFTNTTEAKADVPDDFFMRLVNERAAVEVVGSGPGGLAFTDAEVTVAPFDGGSPWQVPGLVDAVALMPDGSVVYTPDVGEEVDVASLRWVDRDGEPREIDPSVPVKSSGVQIMDGDLVFRVDDGDRSGVWRAALP